MLAEAGENRQREGGRLSCPRLGRADEVAPGHDNWNRAELDRRRVDVARGANAFEHLRSKSEFGEWHPIYFIGMMPPRSQARRVRYGVSQVVTSDSAISDQLHPSKYLRPENNLLIVGDGTAGEVVQFGKTWGRRSLAYIDPAQPCW